MLPTRLPTSNVVLVSRLLYADVLLHAFQITLATSKSPSHSHFNNISYCVIMITAYLPLYIPSLCTINYLYLIIPQLQITFKTNNTSGIKHGICKL